MKRRSRRGGGLKAAVNLPGSIGGSLEVGSDVVAVVKKEVEWLVGQAQEFIGSTGKGVNKNLKSIQKSLKKHAGRQRKKNPTLADYIEGWVNEIDKRLKLGLKGYMKVRKQLAKNVKSMQRMEEKML